MSPSSSTTDVKPARGAVVWVTGLPASGKSSFARAVITRLRERGQACCLLDGDDVRAVLHPRPGYGPAARAAFYDTLGDLAILLARQELIVVIAATASKNQYRHRTRSLAPRYLEVEIATPLEECASRDAKGLYAAAKSGQLPDFPGVGAEYEAPARPDLVASGGFDEAVVNETVARLGA